MALETFKKAFPFTKSDDKNNLELLKKLIDVLPNLDHHKIVERSPQRRGLHVLEEALGKLKPDETAEVLAYLMNHVGDLSQKLSRHKAVSGLDTEGFRDGIFGLGVAGSCAGMFSAGFAGAGIATTATAIVPPMAATLPIIVAGITVANMKSIQKQPQGTALYMLKDQLTELRKNWSDVTPANQEQLTEAFKNLQSSYDKLLGTKTSTLKRFFNDPFIDPSKFEAEPKQGKEWRKKLQHTFITPITSRLKSVPASNIKAIKGDVMKDRDLKAMVLSVTINPSIPNKAEAINHLMGETHLTGKIRGNSDFEKHVAHMAQSAERVAEEDKFLRTTIEVLVDKSYRRQQASVKWIGRDVMRKPELKAMVLGVTTNPEISKEEAINHLMRETPLRGKITNNLLFEKYMDSAPSAERVAAEDKFLRTIITHLVDESYPIRQG